METNLEKTWSNWEGVVEAGKTICSAWKLSLLPAEEEAYYSIYTLIVE